MDFKKIINAALIPTGALVAIWILYSILDLALTFFLQSMLFVAGLVGLVSYLLLLLLTAVILGYAGYSGVKKQKLDLLGAAFAGAVAGFVSSIINGVINSIKALLFPALSPGVTGEIALATGAFTFLLSLVLVAIGVVFWTVVGFVLGAAGGFIAQKM